MDFSICVFCGLPGAGKTTVAKYLCNPTKDLTFIHICYDSLMPSVRHDETSCNEISAWKAARTCILNNVEICLQLIKDNSPGLSPKFDENVIQSELELVFEVTRKALMQHLKTVFIIDDNMYYKGMRYEYFQLCRRFSCGFSTVYFDIPMKTCVANNQRRVESVPEYVIAKLSNQFEIPGKNPKCKWEKYTYTISGDHVLDQTKTGDDILDIISCSKADPPSPLKDAGLEMVRLNIRKSFIHQADLCMRKFVSSEIKEAKRNSFCDIQTLGKRLAFVKANLLTIIKSGYVDDGDLLDGDGDLDLNQLQGKIYGLMKAELGES